MARALAARVGSVARVLVERPGFGRSEHYAPVNLPGEFPPGAIASMRIVASARDHLVGVAA
jgi:threonylcarbamoyladenosine tRNA methylthiotransferase MtaB